MPGEDADTLQALSEMATALAEQASRLEYDDPMAATLDKAPHVAVQWYDASGRILFWNTASEDLYGWSRIEALGRKLDELIYTPEQAKRFLDLFPQVAAGHITVGPEEQHVMCRDGSSLTILAVLFATSDKDGNSVFVCMDVDISKEKKAREALEQERARLHSVFQSIPDLVWLKDAEGVYLACNPAFERLYGAAEADILGKTDFDFVAEELAAFFRENDLLALKAKAPRINKEWLTFAADGYHGLFETIKTPIRDQAGQVIGVLGIARDITLIHNTQAALEESETLLRTVIDENPSIILLSDWDGHCLMGNRALAELYGTTTEALVGRTNTDFHPHVEQDIFNLENIRTIMRGGRTQVALEQSTDLHTGEIRYFQSIKKPLAGPDGEPRILVIANEVTDLRRAQDELERMAHFDALTHLPNRVLLADRLAQAVVHAKRSGRSLAVVYLDLDGFKPINDALGHAVGDELLVKVAQRLNQSVREGDTVARLGGDEFVLLLGNLESVEECTLVLQRVMMSLAAPVPIGEDLLQVSASIGVTLYPDDDSEADSLIRHADQAMYQAKLSGRNRFHFFDPEQDRRLRTTRETNERVLRGLDLGEFELYFQPRVDMRRGNVLGAEALLRWFHPAQGLIMPGGFLPQIQNPQAMIALGRWVIERAMQHLAEWYKAGLSLEISVNIAGVHLLSADFVGHLAQVLAAFPDVPPAMLELEILESTALEDMEAVTATIRQCRELGVRFALDDFGTGYSSLIYLRRLPVDVLKIDQSFVRDMLEDADDRTIVEAVIGLAHAFGREVVAEGVETPEHGHVLLGLGCDQAQGYGIARPMPAAELPGWVKSYAPWLN